MNSRIFVFLDFGNYTWTFIKTKRKRWVCVVDCLPCLYARYAEKENNLRNVSLNMVSHGIHPELLKCAETPIRKALHKLKGQRNQCSSYMPITLLSVHGKVFCHVLLSRLEPVHTRHRRPQQSGFARGRSTLDAVLALWLLSELHCEFEIPLHVAFVDIKVSGHYW